MRIEISSAAQFLVDLVRLNTATPHNKSLSDAQLDRFRSHVADILQRHYTNHWFPEKPCKGSGYRCIRINGKMDPLIARAGFMMGLAVSFLRSLFPTELTMWVDPREVSYRIGENGSICVLYEVLEKTLTNGTTTTAESQKGGETPPPSPPAVSKTPEKVVQVVVSQPAPVPQQQQQQQAPPSPPPTLPQHHQSPPQQQQQVHHQHLPHHHHPHHHQQHHHHHQQQHHFSPSKSVVVSSPLQLSRPMSPVTSQLSQQQNQQQAATAAMQLSMFLMNKENAGLIKCKESLQRGLDVGRPLQMDRLFVSS